MRPPGAGTSALLRVLGGASPPDAGRVVRHAGRARFTRGSDAAAAALDAAEPGSVLLLDHPAEPDADEDAVLGRARWAADRGAAVVVSTHDLGLAARHAHTAALLVAGRLVAWAEPAVAFVPAVRLLGYAGSFPAETATGWEARTAVERTHLRVAG